jgi:hypothetical protein
MTGTPDQQPKIGLTALPVSDNFRVDVSGKGTPVARRQSFTVRQPTSNSSSLPKVKITSRGFCYNRTAFSSVQKEG